MRVVQKAIKIGYGPSHMGVTILILTQGYEIGYRYKRTWYKDHERQCLQYHVTTTNSYHRTGSFTMTTPIFDSAIITVRIENPSCNNKFISVSVSTFLYCIVIIQSNVDFNFFKINFIPLNEVPLTNYHYGSLPELLIASICRYTCMYQPWRPCLTAASSKVLQAQFFARLVTTVHLTTNLHMKEVSIFSKMTKLTMIIRVVLS